MAGDNLDNEFVSDENEIAAALARNEQNTIITANTKVFEANEKMDFPDSELPSPEDILPLDMSVSKIIGEEDYNAMFDSSAIF